MEGLIEAYDKPPLIPLPRDWQCRGPRGWHDEPSLRSRDYGLQSRQTVYCVPHCALTHASNSSLLCEARLGAKRIIS